MSRIDLCVVLSVGGQCKRTCRQVAGSGRTKSRVAQECAAAVVGAAVCRRSEHVPGVSAHVAPYGCQVQ